MIYLNKIIEKKTDNPMGILDALPFYTSVYTSTMIYSFVEYQVYLRMLHLPSLSSQARAELYAPLLWAQVGIKKYSCNQNKM